MIYNEYKTKTMVKSILPSTARKMAKQRKDNLHRRNRRLGAQELQRFHGPSSYVIDEFDDDLHSFSYWEEAHRTDGWDDIVSDRRSADKLAHFEMWAYQKTKHLRPEDRYSKVAGMVPKDIIGEHAMSHLRFLKYEPGVRYGQYDRQMPRRVRYNDRPSRSGYGKRARDEVKAALDNIKNNDFARNKFNTYMRANANHDVYTKQVCDYSVRTPNKWGYLSYDTYRTIREEFWGARTLNGYHDVNKFIDDIIVACYYGCELGYHPSWLRCTKEYFNIH